MFNQVDDPTDLIFFLFMMVMWKVTLFSDEFLKLCPQGVGRGDAGEDINECMFMPDACTGGDCINTDGSFRCECPPGYVLDSTGKACIG